MGIDMSFTERSIFYADLQKTITGTKDELSKLGIKVLDSSVVKQTDVSYKDNFLENYPPCHDDMTSLSQTSYDIIWQTEIPHSLALDLVNLTDVVKTQRSYLSDVEVRYLFCSRRLDATSTKLKLISEFLTKNPSAIEAWNQLVVLAKLNDIDLDLTKV